MPVPTPRPATSSARSTAARSSIRARVRCSRNAQTIWRAVQPSARSPARPPRRTVARTAASSTSPPRASRGPGRQSCHAAFVVNTLEPAGHALARARRPNARSLPFALPGGTEQHRARASRRSNRPRRERHRLRFRPGQVQSAHDRREGRIHRLPAGRDGCHRAGLRHLRVHNRRRVPPEEQRPRRAHLDVPVRRSGELSPLGDARLPRERMGEGTRGRQRLGVEPRTTGDADLRVGRRHRGHDHRQEGRPQRQRLHRSRRRDAGEAHPREGPVRPDPPDRRAHR